VDAGAKISRLYPYEGPGLYERPEGYLDGMERGVCSFSVTPPMIRPQSSANITV
jgi:hypothetical protein